MKIVFMGTPDFSVPILEALVAYHDVICVYTQPPRPAGRGKQHRPSPVQTHAMALGIETRHPTSLRTPEARADFVALNADIAVVVAYGLILPQGILDAPAKGCLNIHASLLPRWRGAAPIHRAIMAGDTETGICIMQMDAGLDTGPVILRHAIPIMPQDTTGDLQGRLAALGAEMILKALDVSLPAQPQSADGVTYAGKIDKAEGRVDWAVPAKEVDRKIRGLSPFPGAWCMVAGERLKLLQSHVADGQGAPGHVLGTLTIACGTGAVAITQAQRAGKRAMPSEDILRGWELPDHLS